MEDPATELSRLLERFRRGELDEEQLLEQIADRDGRRRAAAATHEPSRDRRAHVLERLDAYRAAEQSGAEVLETWAELSDDAALVGGLRTAAAREAKHAALLEQRLRELGGTPTARVPQSIARFNAALTDPTTSDLERLRLMVERFPDVDAAVVPLTDFIDSIDDDELTCELLRTIAVDELSTLRWAHERYLIRRGGRTG